MVENYDVIVIGGGPGGSVASTLLARERKKVLLLERESFPRYHIGESLLSGTADLLKKVNVLDKVEKAGYIKKLGVTWIWGKSRDPWTVYFKDALAIPYDYGYQVERGPFDKMLLDNARENGVNVLERHQVTDLKWEDGRLTGVTYQSLDSGVQKSVEAPWTVDASGQSGFITKQMAQQQWDEKLRNMAIWSYWKHARRPDGVDSGNTLLPTFDEGWWWFIPLRDNITSIGAVIDRQNYPLVQKQGLKEYYLSAIKKTPELSGRLATAEMVDDIRVTKDWSYIYDKFYGKGFIAVGDAACFIDPLLSTGVHLAMLSGYLASITINTLLEDSNVLEEEKVLSFYQQEYSREYRRLKDQIYFLYGGHRSQDSYFWHARKTLDIPSATPKEAFITLIAGAYEHRSWYRRFLNQLEVSEHLKKLAEGIFSGSSAGFNLPLDTHLTKNPRWKMKQSFAIAGSKFKATNILSSDDGRSFPLTENINQILNYVDGKRNFNELLDRVSGDNEKLRNAMRSTLNEAVTHGILIALTT